MQKIINCKNCRKEGEKLFLKGERCLSPKCAFARRAATTGSFSPRKKRTSGYGEQLREKQKVKKIYDVREKQFRTYFGKADKSEGITGEVLLQLLEKRLDNTVFRLGFADTRAGSRQLVSHAHIRLNNKKVDVPSIQVKEGDIISASESFKKKDIFKNISDRMGSIKTPGWLKLDSKKAEGKVIGDPTRDELDLLINESLIVEFYSR